MFGGATAYAKPAELQLYSGREQPAVERRHHLIATQDGWLFLVVVDLFSRKVVSFST